MMIAFDTNLLIYSSQPWYAEHNAARRAIERAHADDRGWGIPLPCIAEFLSAVSHSASVGRPSTSAEAYEFLKSLVIETGAVVWLPSNGFWEKLTRMAADLQVAGSRIYDLQIALIAFENGATEIWTHDRNFTRIPGLRVHDPL